MRSYALQKEKNQIDSLFKDIDSYSGDPYYQALLTYYLCIRVSGFIENCVRIIFLEYSMPNCKRQVKDFVSKKLERFPNPNWAEIVKLVREFNDQWAIDLRNSTTPQHRSSISSIIKNRNNIAHGGTSGITLRELKNYYLDVIHVVEKLEEKCV